MNERALIEPAHRPHLPSQDGLFAGYSREERPLSAYSELVGLYHIAFAVFLVAAKASDRPLPQRVSLSDILLVGVATFKLSRLIAKDIVTSPLRAPFTTYEGPAGEGEVKEKPRGAGMQLALGELLSCPFCMGTWVAAFFAYALALNPSLTRFVAGIFTAHALADGLQLAYGAAAEATRKSSSDGE